VGNGTLSLLRSLFPQIALSRTPAVTSLGNVGAVFHPVAYLLNLPAIRAAAQAGRVFSFYQEGIARKPVVGPIVEEVDQIRLRIAFALGCPVFGLRQHSRCCHLRRAPCWEPCWPPPRGAVLAATSGSARPTRCSVR
jgi:hypothetical protein